ncbi:VTT domain-containing protein [Paenibacillus sp. DMB5]|uniref:TVP38/TMEM64 family protein n=1 Tax=Paenibacillus sp. DMB5 TaxID=1780103 RepID=UPI00076D0379|nr:VTT domain-containing protein [Paenibacillus sp. DMB5]KUP21351.1 hypothetical protein AWJ19_15660 [Paenibacillus sp. DMB5]
MRKGLTVLLYVSVIILAFIYRYDLLDWLREDHSPVLSLFAAVLLALFPVLPYKLVIGLFGYVYGGFWAAVICWSATTIAAAAMYGIVKYLFQQRAFTYLASVPALHKFTSAVQRRPFASIVLARLLPVVPQTAVNIYAGAAGLPFWSYLAASGIGKLPGIALYAFLGGGLSGHPGSVIAALALYGTVLAVAGWSLRMRPLNQPKKR